MAYNASDQPAQLVASYVLETAIRAGVQRVG